MSEIVEVDVLKGKTLKEIKRIKDGERAGAGWFYGDELHFITTEGETFRMYHIQDCCEDVSIEDINGDLEDLIGSQITMAEESTKEGQSEWGTETWTFYKFATNKGYVTIRWYGESNGYYSEEVDFERITKDNEL